MITYDEFIQRFWESNFYVNCITLEETAQATNMLLDIGFRHGNSGYSERIASGDNEEEYMIPFLDDRGRIEYFRSISAGAENFRIIEFNELAEVCGYNVEEFNVDELNLDEFLNTL